MADPAPVQRLSPAATAAIGALATGPVKLVVTGGVGTGKSTVLAAVRDTLREAGTPVVTRAPHPGDPAGAAVVIDDAHLLSGDELGRLTELAGEQDTTLVIATEPRDQDGDLRALTVAIERQRPRLALGPLTAGEAARLLTDPSGHPPPADLVATLMTATGGIPALVSAVIAAPRPHAAPAITQGALFALIERLRRLDEAELDALLITSLSSELGAADVAAALGAPVESARVLVDRVRATGLVEPSHPPRFLRQVHRAVAQMVGRPAVAAGLDADLLAVGLGVAHGGDHVLGVDRLHDDVRVAVRHPLIPHRRPTCGFIPVIAAEEVPPVGKCRHPNLHDSHCELL